MPSTCSFSPFGNNFTKKLEKILFEFSEIILCMERHKHNLLHILNLLFEIFLCTLIYATRESV